MVNKTSYTLLKLCMEKIVGKKMKIFSYVLTYDDPFHNSMHVCLIVYVSVFEIPTAVSLTSSCSVHVTTQRIYILRIYAVMLLIT